MVNINTVKTSWADLVGFKQSRNMSEKLIDYLTSDSGLYFNDAHPLIQHDAFRAMMFEDSRLTYDAYSGATAYSVGDIVTSDSKTWLCIQAGTGNTPEDSAAYWKEYDAYTEFLGQFIDSAISDVVYEWIGRKGEENTLEGTKEQDRLFQTSAENDNTDTADTYFRGLRIDPQRSKFLKIQIEKISVSFISSWDFNLLLYKTGVQGPVKTKAISYPGTATAKDELWIDLTDDEWILDGSGSYFIGYQATESSPASLNGVISNIPEDDQITGYCRSQYLDVYGFHVEDTVTALWPLDQAISTTGTNYGLNFEYSIYCDFTEIFTKNRLKFARALQQCVVLKMLSWLKNNPQARINRHFQNIDKLELDFEIHGDPQGRPSGIRYQYISAIKALTIDFGVDEFCLPCAKRGIGTGKM